MIVKRISARKNKSNVARLVRYVVNAQGGVDPRSWTRTADYILDTNTQANSKGEKVGGVRVTNCGTDDPADATLLIEATQKVNMRSKNDRTYHLVFSFPPGEQPTEGILNSIEDELCASIGYADHQRISAVHVDKDHLHVHVVINKIHPTGFQNIEPFFDKKRLMEACARLEIKHGLERTHGKERENERTRRIQLAPERSPTDRDSLFRRYLRESYNLPIAERPKAKTLNGLRELSGCHMARDLKYPSVLLQNDARFSLFGERAELVDGLRWQGDGHRANFTAGQPPIGDKVADLQEQTGIEMLATYVARIVPDLQKATNWRAVHEKLAEHGLEIKTYGAGLVIGDSELSLWVRASQCSRSLSMKAMTDRLGTFEPSHEKHLSKTAYVPRPVHKHPDTSKLFAQYEAVRQEQLAHRKIEFARLKQENADYQGQLRAWKKAQRILLAGTRGAVRKMLQANIRSKATAAWQKQAFAMQQKRKNVYESTKMLAWNDWLIQQAEGGNVQALDVLRSRIERDRRVQGDLLTAKNAEQAKSVVLKALKPVARRDGSIAYRTTDGGIIIDHKNRVQVQKVTTAAALVALSVASGKFGDQPLDVNGTDEFKAEVARLAGLHKLNVTFSDPVLNEIKIKAGKEHDDTLEGWITRRNEVVASGAKDILLHEAWHGAEGDYKYQGRRTVGSQKAILFSDGEKTIVKAISEREFIQAGYWKRGDVLEIRKDGKARRQKQEKGREFD